MNWLEIAAIALVCLGLVAGAFLFARRPEFWIEFGIRLFQRVWPFALGYFMKLGRRHDPETERRMQECVRRGGRWNNVKKRCE